MSFHGQRLRQLRARAGLYPLPNTIYRDGYPAGFVDSIDPRFYSAAARYWHDAVCNFAAPGNPIPKSERAAFLAVGRVLRMSRDERDEKVRRQFLMPPAQEQHDYDSLMYHHAAEALKSQLLAEEMRRRGYEYGPDHELPDDVILPSADALFDRAMAERYGETPGAVRKKRERWRAAYKRVVRGRG